jgi:AbrB family looped-hinge helix DNA binding protein
MAEATLSSKNQIVIPREAREALQLKPGDKLIVTAHAGKILILEKPKSYSKAIRGLVPRGYYGKDYVRQERQSWE